MAVPLFRVLFVRPIDRSAGSPMFAFARLEVRLWALSYLEATVLVLFSCGYEELSTASATRAPCGQSP